MRVLLDHCVPRPFGRLLAEHAVHTTAEQGWAELSNGKLLTEASTQFDVFLTVDQSILHQHNLNDLPIAVVIIVTPSNRLDRLAPFAQKVLSTLAGKLAKRVYLIEHIDD